MFANTLMFSAQQCISLLQSAAHCHAVQSHMLAPKTFLTSVSPRGLSSQGLLQATQLEILGPRNLADGNVADAAATPAQEALANGHAETAAQSDAISALLEMDLLDSGGPYSKFVASLRVRAHCVCASQEGTPRNAKPSCVHAGSHLNCAEAPCPRQ